MTTTKASWFNFDTNEFVPENMSEKTRGWYENHCKKMNRINELIETVRKPDHSIDDEIELLSFLTITHHKNTARRNSKLHMIDSISTLAILNKTCRARRNIENCICQHCYAVTQQLMFPTLFMSLYRNWYILTATVYSIEALKTLKFKNDVIRFESFGEVDNDVQIQNYINIAKSFPEKKAGAWTKNPMMWVLNFKELGKPENLAFGLSSYFVNKTMEVPEVFEPYVDFTFTVFDDDFAKMNHVVINCGGRQCITCMRCYDSNQVDGIVTVNELKK
jgi:hypothetical protein